MREVTGISSAIGPHVPNLGAVWSHFLTAMGYCFFLTMFHHKGYGQVIINDDHNVHLLLGLHVPNLGAVVTFFDRMVRDGARWYQADG